MTDRHSKEIRSYNMSRVRGKNTKPELLVRRFLFSKGFRYKLHDSKLPGKPDIVLPKYSTVIFVNGCFWHGHEHCKYYTVPMTRTDWWVNKINKNSLNDKSSYKILDELGWNVLIIWGCELKPKALADTLDGILKRLSHRQDNIH